MLGTFRESQPSLELDSHQQCVRASHFGGIVQDGGFDFPSKRGGRAVDGESRWISSTIEGIALRKTPLKKLKLVVAYPFQVFLGRIASLRESRSIQRTGAKCGFFQTEMPQRNGIQSTEKLKQTGQKIAEFPSHLIVLIYFLFLFTSF